MVATASTAGRPHLVPLSVAWDGRTVLLAVPRESATARNVAETGHARIALDSAANVAIVDTDGAVVAFADAQREHVSAFVDRTGWNPEDEDPGLYAMLLLTPRRVLAWNGLDESLAGRTIMRNGVWLAD